MRKAIQFKVRKSTVFWSTLLGVGAAADLYLIRKGYFEDTLTHHGRRWTGYHPDASPRRKWSVRAGWVLAAVWVVNHFAFGPHEDGRVHRFVVNLLLEAKTDGKA